jgi:hypothetical protein
MTDANTFVITKVVAQYFNPTDYSKYGDMQYASQMLNWFQYNQTDFKRSYSYNLAQNKVYFSNNTFYDLDGTGWETIVDYYSIILQNTDFTA